MDLTPYVDSLRRELMVAADAGGEDARAVAERLVAPLESSIRLTLLGALSAAADEITRDLAPGSVDLRLRGLDPSFVVTPAPVSQPFPEGGATGTGPAGGSTPAGAGPSTGTGIQARPSASTGGEDEGGTARINFRPPEQLKARIEEAASWDGISVNAWLIRTVTATLGPRGTGPDQRPPSSGKQFKGWVR